MPKCKLSPDDDQECVCRVRKRFKGTKARWTCIIYDEPLKGLRKCPLVQPSKKHRTIDGLELTKAREAMRLSQHDFAARCGWEQPYQCQLEHAGKHEVRIETAKMIMEVLGKEKI